MLHVLCRIGHDPYAISCGVIERVVPYASLKALPGAPRGIVGLLNYRGRAVPVVDLNLALTDEPARELLGTRIILCPFESSPSGLLGLLAEHVTHARDLREGDFDPTGVKADSCLEDVAVAGRQFIQRIEIPGILPPGVLEGLGIAPEFDEAA